MMVFIDRLEKRLVRYGVCHRRRKEPHDTRTEREWRGLSMRKAPVKRHHRPRRVECPRCGVRVKDFSWARA